MSNRYDELNISKCERDLIELKEKLIVHYVVLSPQGRVEVVDSMLNSSSKIGNAMLLLEESSVKLYITDENLLLLVDGNNKVIQSMEVYRLIDISRMDYRIMDEVLSTDAKQHEIIYNYAKELLDKINHDE